MTIQTYRSVTRFARCAVAAALVSMLVRTAAANTGAADVAQGPAPQAKKKGPAVAGGQAGFVEEPSNRIVYKTVGDRKLELHVFNPTGHKASDRRACYVIIHGGGWSANTTERYYPFAAHFAKLGCVGISLDYRLVGKANGVTVFDCVKDGRSAVRYLRQHAVELGIDPQKIIVGGGSAGGHVAAGTAMFDGVDEMGEDLKISCVPNALVLYFSVVDTSPEGFGNAKCGERWQEISPLHRVRSGLPPTIVLHGTADTTTPFKGARAFAEAMLKAGNRCELITHLGGIHGYLLPVHGMELFNEAMAQTETFLISLNLIDRATTPEPRSTSGSPRFPRAPGN